MELETMILRSSGLDRGEAAKAMGISRMTFWRVCNHQQVFAPYLAIKTAALFDIPLDTLLKKAGYSSRESEEICNYVKKISFSDGQEARKAV